MSGKKGGIHDGDFRTVEVVLGVYFPASVYVPISGLVLCTPVEEELNPFRTQC